MKRFFLVDLENVGHNCIKGIESLGTDDTIILCHNKMIRDDVPDTIIQKMKTSRATVKTMYIDNRYKNAMDFNLCVELGFLVAEYKNTAKYYIVSNDKGFDVAADFIKSQKFQAEIKRIPSILADYSAEEEEKEIRQTVEELLTEYNSYEKKMVLKALAQCHSRSLFHNYLKDHLKENIYRDVYNRCKSLVA